MRSAGETPVEDFNLLVSIYRRAPGRARHEVLKRLAAVGDETPEVARTVAAGILAVRTGLDPRQVVEGLRRHCELRPAAFRYTTKWVPVDRWAWPEMAAMREAVTGLRDRIRPEDTWRMTVERRAETPVDADAIISELAEIIDARVDLRRPDKILLVQLFGNRVAFSVLGPADVFSVVKVLAARPAPTPGGTTTATGDEEATRLTA